MDRRLPELQHAADVIKRNMPHSGWLRAIRAALGIGSSALGRRLRTAHSSALELEQNEVSGSITLASLKRAAEALGADFVYAIVPRKKLRDMISARAHEIATEQVLGIARHMALEQQGISREQIKRQIEELSKELEEKPRELWR
jgi:predicted DNA-binding mobile mystery protein A